MGTSGISGTYGDDITSDLAYDVGRAVASEGADRVVVGCDSRQAGDHLEQRVSAGLREAGADVVSLGVVATPTVARAITWQDADAGIVVAASHYPPTDNGLKLWNDRGMAFTDSQRDAISRRVIEENFTHPPADETGDRETVDDAIDRHVAELVPADQSLADITVVVDERNGAGQVTVEALRTAGADVTTLDGQADDTYPGRVGEQPDAHSTELAELVQSIGADLGIAHDGDADRMMAVDETGRFVGGDQLVALFADAAAEPGDRVSIPVNTSLAVEEFLERREIGVVRTKVGDDHVAEAVAADDLAFGGDPSGAWIWPAESLCPDGPLAAVTLASLVQENGPLSALADRIERYPIRRETVEVTSTEPVLDRLTREVERDFDAVQTLDGVRVERGEGWFLVRASETEPLLRVTAEARDEQTTTELFETAIDYVESAR